MNIEMNCLSNVENQLNKSETSNNRTTSTVYNIDPDQDETISQKLETKVIGDININEHTCEVVCSVYNACCTGNTLDCKPKNDTADEKPKANKDLSLSQFDVPELIKIIKGLIDIIESKQDNIKVNNNELTEFALKTENYEYLNNKDALDILKVENEIFVSKSEHFKSMTDNVEDVISRKEEDDIFCLESSGSNYFKDNSGKSDDGSKEEICSVALSVPDKIKVVNETVTEVVYTEQSEYEIELYSKTKTLPDLRKVELNIPNDQEKEDKDDADEGMTKKHFFPSERVEENETETQIDTAFEIDSDVNISTQNWNSPELDPLPLDVKIKTNTKHNIGNENKENDRGEIQHESDNTLSARVENEDENKIMPVHLESKNDDFDFREEDYSEEEREKRVNNIIDIKTENSNTKSSILYTSENENGDEESRNIEDNSNLSKQMDYDDESLRSQEELKLNNQDSEALSKHDQVELGADKDMKILKATSIRSDDEIEWSSSQLSSNDTKTSNDYKIDDDDDEDTLKSEKEIKQQHEKKNEQVKINEHKKESLQSHCIDEPLSANEASSAYLEENNVEEVYRAETVTKRYLIGNEQMPAEMNAQEFACTSSCAEDEIVLKHNCNTNYSFHEQVNIHCPGDVIQCLKETIRSDETQMLSHMSLTLETKQPNNDHCDVKGNLDYADKYVNQSENNEHKNKLEAQKNEHRQPHYNDKLLQSQSQGMANATCNGEYTVSETKAIDTEKKRGKSNKTFNESEYIQQVLTETIDCEVTIVKEIVHTSVEWEAPDLIDTNKDKSKPESTTTVLTVEEDYIAHNEETTRNDSSLESSNLDTDSEDREITSQRRDSGTHLSDNSSSQRTSNLINQTDTDNTVPKLVYVADEENYHFDHKNTMALLKIGNNIEDINMYDNIERIRHETEPKLVTNAVGYETNRDINIYAQQQFDPEDDDFILRELPQPDFPFNIQAIMHHIPQQNVQVYADDNMQAMPIENRVNVPVAAEHVGESPPIPETEACAIQATENRVSVENIVDASICSSSIAHGLGHMKEPDLSQEVRDDNVSTMWTSSVLR